MSFSWEMIFIIISIYKPHKLLFEKNYKLGESETKINKLFFKSWAHSFVLFQKEYGKLGQPKTISNMAFFRLIR